MLIRDVKLIIFSWGCAYAVCDRRFLFSPSTFCGVLTEVELIFLPLDLYWRHRRVLNLLLFYCWHHV